MNISFKYAFSVPLKYLQRIYPNSIFSFKYVNENILNSIEKLTPVKKMAIDIETFIDFSVL